MLPFWRDMGFERERKESLRPSAAQGQWHGLSVHAGYSSRAHIMAMSKLPPEVSAAVNRRESEAHKKAKAAAWAVLRGPSRRQAAGAVGHRKGATE